MDETGEPRNHVIFYDEDGVQYLAERGRRLQEFAKQGVKLRARVTDIFELPKNEARILFDPGSQDAKFGRSYITPFKQGDIG